MLMNSFTFSFEFHTTKDFTPCEFLGNKYAENKTLVALCNLREFFFFKSEIFHSYNLDLALFPSGKKPHKPRHKYKGKSNCQFGLPLPSPVL